MIYKKEPELLGKICPTQTNFMLGCIFGWLNYVVLHLHMPVCFSESAGLWSEDILRKLALAVFLAELKVGSNQTFTKIHWVRFLTHFPARLSRFQICRSLPALQSSCFTSPFLTGVVSEQRASDFWGFVLLFQRMKLPVRVICHIVLPPQ